VPLLPRLGLALSCAALLTAAVASPSLAGPADQTKTRTSPVAAVVKPKKAPADPERALIRERRLETKRGAAFAATALEYVGYPYRWGGRSPDSGFDCSGFTMFVYSTVGLELPRDLGGQLESGRWIEQDELIPGDLLIFANTYRRGISHSAVYLGDGQFVHANDESTGVVVSTFANPYWTTRFYGASRPGR
jgi:cell wall-associated NlpC family hydrolase